MKRIFSKKNKGSITIELLIAFAILLINITGVVLIINGGQSISLDTKTNNEALSKAQNILEETKSKAQLDFNLVNPFSYPEDGDIYNKKLLVEQVDLFTKKIIGEITWRTDGNRSQRIELVSLLTNPEAINGGDTCSSVLEGDWKNPKKTEYEFGADILEDTSSGFPITSIQAFNQKLYVTVNNEHGNNFKTFFIVDISNPEMKPELIGNGIDNSPKNGHSDGLNSVAVDGDYAYVANAYNANYTTCDNLDGSDPTCGQMQIIDIKNSENPIVKYTLKLPGVTGSNGVGSSIFYKNGYVYLGLVATGLNNGPEFHIIDVHDPLSPVVVGSWPEIGNNFNNEINSIFVSEPYVYLAHPTDNDSPYFEQITVLDISDPSNPNRIGGLYFEDGIGGNGKSLYKVGNKIYLGRTASNISHNADNLPEFFILDIKDFPSTSIIVDGSLTLQTAVSINGLIVRQFLAFLITSKQFQIWDISDTNEIKEYASPLSLPPGEGGPEYKGTASDCEGNYIFIGSKGDNDKGYISIITGS